MHEHVLQRLLFICACAKPSRDSGVITYLSYVFHFLVKWDNNGQVRIQDLVKGGPQVLRPKVADIAKRSRPSEASKLRPGSRARLRALEAFEFLMLKYAFSHILETLFL